MLGLRRPRMRLRAAAVVGGLMAAAGAAGWAVGASTGQDAFNARAYARQRVPIISAKMRDAAPGFILFAGDSHVDLYREPSSLCGQDTVNAGLSGANAEVYAGVLEQFTFSHKASMAVLTIGTNDLLRKRKPAPSDYEAGVERILKRLEKVSDRIVATAIPPVGEDQARYFNVDAIEDYSGIVARTCSRFERCSFFDPYKDLRQAENFGISRSGVMADGLHAKDYRKVYEQLPLCRILSASQ